MGKINRKRIKKERQQSTSYARPNGNGPWSPSTPPNLILFPRSPLTSHCTSMSLPPLVKKIVIAGRCSCRPSHSASLAQVRTTPPPSSLGRGCSACRCRPPPTPVFHGSTPPSLHCTLHGAAFAMVLPLDPGRPCVAVGKGGLCLFDTRLMALVASASRRLEEHQHRRRPRIGHGRHGPKECGCRGVYQGHAYPARRHLG
jgi:hypothetical protein